MPGDDEKEYCFRGLAPTERGFLCPRHPCRSEDDREVIEWMIFHIDDQVEFDEFFNIDPQFTFEIAFGDPEIVKGEPLVDTINQMVDAVQAVVDSFVGFQL